LRLEIEPGRYYVAPGLPLVSAGDRCEQTRSNEKGQRSDFAMVRRRLCRSRAPGDVRQLSRHRYRGQDDEDPNVPREPIVVAGPLCESGDIFTRDDHELLAPRLLPRPAAGDLLTCATPARMATRCRAITIVGRAPQLWLEEGREVWK